jgi:hypothetical protein
MISLPRAFILQVPWGAGLRDRLPQSDGEGEVVLAGMRLTVRGGVVRRLELPDSDS